MRVVSTLSLCVRLRTPRGRYCTDWDPPRPLGGREWLHATVQLVLTPQIRRLGAVWLGTVNARVCVLIGERETGGEKRTGGGRAPACSAELERRGLC